MPRWKEVLTPIFLIKWLKISWSQRFYRDTCLEIVGGARLKVCLSLSVLASLSLASLMFSSICSQPLLSTSASSTGKFLPTLEESSVKTVIIRPIPRTLGRTKPWTSWPSVWGTSQDPVTEQTLLLFLHHVVFRVTSISQSQETPQAIITSPLQQVNQGDTVQVTSFHSTF